MRKLLLLVIPAVVLAICFDSRADDLFRGTLSHLPIDSKLAPSMTGTGSLDAALMGSTLSLHGTFDGTGSNPVAAAIHVAAPGLRGPAIFKLDITHAGTGTLTGSVSLTAPQVADLKKGWFYVQIDTEKNPDGQLRGWLFGK